LFEKKKKIVSRLSAVL